jgi:hypothetical protein
VRTEIRSLLMRRNDVAAAYRDAIRIGAEGIGEAVGTASAATVPLPPVINDTRMCSGCFVQEACFALAAASGEGQSPSCGDDGGDAGASAFITASQVLLKEPESTAGMIQSATRHLSDDCFSYFRRWWSLVDLESSCMADAGQDGMTGFWSVPAGMGARTALMFSCSVVTARGLPCSGARAPDIPVLLGNGARQCRAGIGGDERPADRGGVAGSASLRLLVDVSSCSSGLQGDAAAIDGLGLRRW